MIRRSDGLFDHTTKPYAVHLKFAGSGISRSCTCPYQGDVCKHMVATAIVWDEWRGLARPSTEDVETETIPPPPVTRAQIHAVFASPLKADLDVLHLASESRGWSRPHSRSNFPSNIHTSIRQRPTCLTTV